ncbi:MAG: GNAT family N-acetyltransferase [Symploca sp. SIO3C6]|uniref:GNAT family N-acetyltransferase n=1 Tax=Symploca sp. SIO1C4 TaxID=2607765 RepID=A0A6B3N577_9CYAN|nr:GNAT family N-acetyltransferase [Symploca sp. SIO3C6]NER28856.1 GNAT family N-acetyltransferase [Symploca sp. SIO1C4]
MREATEKDFEGICKLIKSQEELFLIYPNGKYPLTVAQVKELSQVRKELTVAVEGKTIIGFANFYDYQRSKHAFIGNVVIAQSCRGRGLGKKIVSYMLKIAYEKYNLPEVRISVFNQNTPALLLYSGLGFTPYEIEERKSPQGNRIALIHMKVTRINHDSEQ